jgi:hypothetical protein
VGEWCCQSTGSNALDEAGGVSAAMGWGSSPWGAFENYRALISNSSEYTAKSTKHAPLISNSPDEDSKYFSILRRRLTSNGALHPFET